MKKTLSTMVAIFMIISCSSVWAYIPPASNQPAKALPYDFTGYTGYSNLTDISTGKNTFFENTTGVVKILNAKAVYNIHNLDRVIESYESASDTFILPDVIRWDEVNGVFGKSFNDRSSCITIKDTETRRFTTSSTMPTLQLLLNSNQHVVAPGEKVVVNFNIAFENLNVARYLVLRSKPEGISGNQLSGPTGHSIGRLLHFQVNGGVSVFTTPIPNQKFRFQPKKWYNIQLVFTSGDGTAANRNTVDLYADGIKLTENPVEFNAQYNVDGSRFTSIADLRFETAFEYIASASRYNPTKTYYDDLYIAPYGTNYQPSTIELIHTDSVINSMLATARQTRLLDFTYTNITLEELLNGLLDSNSPSNFASAALLTADAEEAPELVCGYLAIETLDGNLIYYLVKNYSLQSIDETNVIIDNMGDRLFFKESSPGAGYDIDDLRSYLTPALGLSLKFFRNNTEITEGTVNTGDVAALVEDGNKVREFTVIGLPDFNKPYADIKIINSGSNYSATGSIYTFDTTTDAVLILAVTDADQQLERVVFDRKTNVSGNVSFEIGSISVSPGSTVKAMLWDSLGVISPFVSGRSIHVNIEE